MLSTAVVHDVETTSPACFGNLSRDMSKTRGGGGGALAGPGSKTRKTAKNIFCALLIFEARRETTCIQGYRPCPQQTGLHRHRRWLKGLKFRVQGSRGIVLSMKRKQRS